MAYIGNKLADSYTSFAKQDFTTSATTSYTLDYPVANANEIALFINFVRQEPTTAYTATGTSLTLTSATSASDDMYAVFLGKALQTVNPPAGSVGTSQLASSIITGQTEDTTPADNDLILTYDTSTSVLKKVQKSNLIPSSVPFTQIVTSQNTNTPSGSGTGYIYSSSFAEIDSRFRLQITPTSTSHKILLFCTCGLYNSNEAGGDQFMTIYRDSTNLGDSTGGLQNQTHDTQVTPFTFVVVDTPSTTSQITYKLYVRNSTASSGTYLNNGGGGQVQFIAMEFLGS